MNFIPKLLKVAFSLPLSLIVFFFGLAQPTWAIDGFVKITSPSGGETFTEGNSTTIYWDSSENIDKVNIMYKSDAHHGNWIAFTHPNTGSYNWNVDVGNTTNTSFFIQITGYETGKGSVTASSETFTVLQKETPPPQASPALTPTPQTTTSEPQPTPTPTPQTQTKITTPSVQEKTPTPQFTWLSITNISLWTIFNFEGSETTDLSQIEDPQHVENFTLDTQEGFTFVFKQDLDLTNQTTLNSLSNLEEFWVIDIFFLWIKQEWWIDYKIETPIEVTYKNEQLTSFTPEVVEVTEKEAKQTTTKKPNYSILGAEAGEVKIELTGGAKLQIEPKVVIDGNDEITIDKSSHKFTGHTSHKNLTYSAKVNGTTRSLKIKDFDEESGVFSTEISGFVKGANFVQFYYTDPESKDSQPKLIAEKTVYYQPNLWIMLEKIILIIILILLSITGGYLLKIKLPVLRYLGKKLLKRLINLKN